MNILFVCSENRLRSPTAEAVFQEYAGVNAIGAGTNKDAPTAVSGDLIEWADAILVMENSHRDKIAKKFRTLLKGKKLAVLGIRDEFEFMDTALVDLLRVTVPRYVRV